jgi:predicted lipoprotein with Yx(FWY)xxD motif
MISTSRIRSLVATVAISLGAASIVACGSGGSGGSGGNSGTAISTSLKTASGRVATIGLADNAALGRVLVDPRGRTLYLFQKDAAGKSACGAACAAAWPPLRAKGEPVTAQGLTSSKLGITSRPNGTRQVTYNGHPLYRYTGDTRPGDANGQGLSAFGAPWFAVSSAGTVVSRPGSNPGSASGY